MPIHLAKCLKLGTATVGEDCGTHYAIDGNLQSSNVVREQADEAGYGPIYTVNLTKSDRTDTQWQQLVTSNIETNLCSA